MSTHQVPGSTSLATALRHALHISRIVPTKGYFYSSHSPRIRDYNELRLLGMDKDRLMKRMDWETETMLRVYLDSRISVTALSSYFFAHIIQTS